MPWTTTHDPGEFLAAAGGFVRSRLVEHNVILSIIARLGYGGLVLWDATNPVTNSIYQRLGYRPAEDRLILTFT